MDVQPVTLEGRHVRLEPLTMAHHAPLCEVGLEDEIWRWMRAPIRTPEEMASFIEGAIREQEQSKSLPFATIDRASGRVAGSTRFLEVTPADRHVEIGWTWIGRPWRRTAVNTEAKYLMLRHAFEVLGCIRVELKTDALNERSRAAIRRIGAKEEGTFRNHVICSDGRIRDSVYYSIIDSEWPAIKTDLEAKLDRSSAPEGP